jgi:hypothetical protein
LTLRGIDVEALNARFRKVEADISQSRMASPGSPNFPHVPENHWVYEALDRMSELGLVTARERYGSGPPDSRYRFALRALASVHALRTLPQSLNREGELLGRLPATRERVRRQAELMTRLAELGEPDVMIQLKRVIRAFSKELTTLRRPPTLLLRELDRAMLTLSAIRIPEVGSALVQFADVPQGHWAGNSLQALRASGVLRGYPSGKFTRSRQSKHCPTGPLRAAWNRECNETLGSPE